MIRAVVVADGGARAGLGHLSRSSALGVALRTRGIDVVSFGNGIAEPTSRDGMTWGPLETDVASAAAGADVVVVDSYLLDVEALDSTPPLVVLHEHVDPPSARLVVNAGAPSEETSHRRLCGLAYASLRPRFWGVPSRRLDAGVQRVLVATGGADPGGAGVTIARQVAAALPDVEVTLVRGPYADDVADNTFRSVRAPESLFELLLDADIVVTAGGQTLLEAAATGVPTVAVVLAENQRAQAERVVAAGAAVIAPPGEVGRAVASLAEDRGARSQMSSAAQSAVDGFGALRVAFHLERIALEAR